MNFCPSILGIISGSVAPSSSCDMASTWAVVLPPRNAVFADSPLTVERFLYDGMTESRSDSHGFTLNAS